MAHEGSGPVLEKRFFSATRKRRALPLKRGKGLTVDADYAYKWRKSADHGVGISCTGHKFPLVWVSRHHQPWLADKNFLFDTAGADDPEESEPDFDPGRIIEDYRVDQRKKFALYRTGTDPKGRPQTEKIRHWIPEYYKR